MDETEKTLEERVEILEEVMGEVYPLLITLRNAFAQVTGVGIFTEKEQKELESQKILVPNKSKLILPK